MTDELHKEKFTYALGENMNTHYYGTMWICKVLQNFGHRRIIDKI